jgi:nicotinate-nucleotide adenylyltransferase
MMEEIGVADENIIKQPHLWHGFTAAYILETEFKISDQKILNAVRFHTISSPDFDLIGKILYIADYIEPARKQTRKFCIANDLELDNLLKEIVNEKINYFVSKDYAYNKNINLLAEKLK